jgi:ferric-dicitrate binding protein FerR (iron transport regulator)
MALSKEQLEGLYNKYIQNQCTQQELETLINELGSAENMNEEEVTQLFNTTWEGLEVFPDKYVLPELSLPQHTQGTNYETPVIEMYTVKRRWIRIGAAASILLILGAAAFWLVRTRETKLATTPSATIKDISPGGNKAVLTLADNSTIVLDNAANGKLAQQGNAEIEKLNNGQLIYSQGNRNGDKSLTIDHSPLTYNTLRTPRGGQYQLILSDGSKVWLNAASAITYPTVFTGKERKITIDGEAYLEVAHDAKKPFKVQANGTEVEVLGTQFNVHAYSDESLIKTTLVQGKVKVSGHRSMKKEQVILQPGEQAQIKTGSSIQVEKQVDMEEVLAWKNGLFRFNNADIGSVMKQVERWYDVEVVYEGEKPEGHFRGKVPRNVMASEMLKIIEASGVQCRIENKKIIIMK